MDSKRPKAKMTTPFKLAELVETDQDSRVGISSLDDIDWKAKMMIDGCVSCGRCDLVCPMQKIFSNFSYGIGISPRGIIKKVSLGLDVLKDKEIWFCQDCTACTEICPAGVTYAEFIISIRLLAIKQGIIENCSSCERCGQYYLPTPTLDNIKGILEKRELSSDYVNLCPRCRKYDYLKATIR